MFERILVAVDGSPESGKTIGVAVDLAQRYNSAVTVVHVREYERYEGSDVDMGPPVPAEQLVGGVLETFREKGIDARGEVRRVSSGVTPEQIVKVAKESSADLIILGTHGRGRIRQAVFGSVANAVTRQAPCPVLTVAHSPGNAPSSSCMRVSGEKPN